MEEQQYTPQKLFSHIKDIPMPNPMQFAIILQHLLVVECKRVIRCIEDHGGEFMGFDPEDNTFINLASPKYKAPPGQITFDIKYIKRCANEKRLLNLSAFQLSGEKMKGGPECIPFYDLLEAKKCKHIQTPEEVLDIIMDKISKPKDA